MITLALLWILWCFLHSLLITGWLNRWIENKGGFLQGAHRLFYVGFSCLSLIPVLWYQFSLPQQQFFSWHGPWRILQFLLLFYAVIMFYGGKKVYDTSYFLGIRQWKNYRHNQEPQSLPFTSKGILRYVRHPWYSGSLTFLWAMGPLTDVTILARTLLSLYLVIGTLLEEHKLKLQIGEPYHEYCRQVPMLIPWKGKM
ncbi:MAG: hypothetical protein DSY70_00785 [Desulfobulbus sp.]|nr:MAG: hypothetical protein DSY70_00785 [Desulfobulbus sp.]